MLSPTCFSHLAMIHAFLPDSFLTLNCPIISSSFCGCAIITRGAPPPMAVCSQLLTVVNSAAT